MSAEGLSAYSPLRWPIWPVGDAKLTPHGAESIGYMGKFVGEWLQSQGLLNEGDKQHERDDAVFIYSDVDDRTFDSATAIARSLSPSRAEQHVHSADRQRPDPLYRSIRTGACTVEIDKVRADTAAYFGTDTVEQTLNMLIAKHRSTLETLGKHVRFEESSLARSLRASGALPAGGTIADIRQELAAPDRWGTQPVTGPLKIGADLAAAFLLQYAQAFPESDVAWGTAITPEQWHAMGALIHDIHLMRYGTPYLASRDGTLLMQHILASLSQHRVSAKSSADIAGTIGNSPSSHPRTSDVNAAVLSRFAVSPATVQILVGHDTNVIPLAGLLDLDWTLAGQPIAAAPGEAMIFALWHDTVQHRDYVQIRIVTQTMAQLRAPAPLTVLNAPPSIVLLPPRCEKKGPYDMCELDDFLRLTTEKLARECL